MHARARTVAALLVVVGGAWPVNLSAHALLDKPAPRDDRDGYKDSTPCGVTRMSGQPATRYAPGQALDVEWLETVDHSGCFLIEFSEAGDQNFQILARKSHSNPPAPADPTSAAPRRWNMPITLPNVSCEACTLRLRQLMLDNNVDANACPPADIPAGAVYTTCANISLGSGGGASGGSGGMGGAPTGGAGGAAGGVGGAPTGGAGGAAGGMGGTPTGGAAGSAGSASGSTSGGSASGGSASGGASGGSSTAAGAASVPAGSDEGGCTLAGPRSSGMPAMLLLGLAWLGARRTKLLRYGKAPRQR